MAYMLYERIAMEVVTAYLDRPDAEEGLRAATAHRTWLAALPIDAALRAGLLEPIAALEDGFREALRRRERDAAAGEAVTAVDAQARD